MNLLDPEAYTIAWIAPLQIEARAALLLLDKRHQGRFPVGPGDDYTYEAGEMCSHNVIIATLPSGQMYGTGSAAAIAGQVKKSFPRLWLGLLVGVAAGLPNLQRDPPLDIRLGDVLVGMAEGDNPGLIAYDIGKETAKDGFQPLHLGRALPQTERLIRSAISSIMLHAPDDAHVFLPYYEQFSDKLHRHGSFADPGQEHDVLYQIDNEEGERLVPREPRPNSGRTRVWYGPIGSGDKLMKNARTRNELRDRYNIIGLEMEAAGTMTCIPVGVIRGVCDYGDEHKNKQWQPYAAAMAAAYAKAVLARIPPKVVVHIKGQVIQNVAKVVAAEVPSRPKQPLDDNSLCAIIGKAKSPRIDDSDAQGSKPAPNSVSSRQQQEWLDKDQRKALLDSLAFDQIDSRHDTIETAYGNTCEWLSRIPEYFDWFESSDKLAKHHGFLWIKGHPGAGKSTLMKSALHKAQKTKRGSFISFFFNARGDELQKSTIGMYRSLLFQLLDKIPRLQTGFSSLGRTARNGNVPRWSIESLKSFFRYTVQNLEQSPLTCFIDALDECGVTQIRDMISFFEDVGEMAVSRGISFRVCLSSRHYPHITISKGLCLDLGQQQGHDQDIVSYINGKLKMEDGKLAQQIRTRLIEKASGIFIWIVVVVGILQQEYDDGHKHSLLQRLEEIPGDLNHLFRDILSRDSRHKAELLLCIQWVLFSRQPLRTEQLYLAILVGVDPIAASDWSPDQVGDADVRRFILSSSKGLVEVNKSRTNAKVQFIHESVREFFFKDGLRRIWPELKGDFRGESHERLKQSCCKYMIIANASADFEPLRPSFRERGEPAWFWKQQVHALTRKVCKSAETKFPLLEYAVRTVLHHANEAAAFGVDQASFLHSFDRAGWIKLKAVFDRRESRLHLPTTSLLYILAQYNAAKLIEIHTGKLSGFQVEEGDERYGMPILAAVATNSRRAVYALLKAQANAEPPTSPLHSLCEQYDQNKSKQSRVGRAFEYSKRMGVLANLAAAGDEQVVDFALASDKMTINVDWKGMEGATALTHACRNGQDAIVRKILDKGVCADKADGTGMTALHHSARKGHEAMVSLLLNSGASHDTTTTFGRTPLDFAAEGGHVAVMRLLLDAGAQMEAAYNNEYTLSQGPVIHNGLDYCWQARPPLADLAKDTPHRQPPLDCFLSFS